MDQKFNPLGRRRSSVPVTMSDADVTAQATEITGVNESEARPSDLTTVSSYSTPEASPSVDPIAQTPSIANSGPTFPLTRRDEVSQREAVIRVKPGVGRQLPENEPAFTPDVASAASLDSQEAGALFGGFQTSWFRTLGLFGWCVLVLLGAGFLLVTLSQTAVLVREINSWIFPAQVAGWISLGAIWLAVAIASVQLARVFNRYRQSPGVSLSALEKIREREANRALAVQSEKAAADKVRQFLNEYPTDENQCLFLKQVMGADGQASLLQEHKQLLAENHGVAVQWLDKVRKRYTCQLDKTAREIVNRHSMAIGFGTAVSPRGAIDSLIVLVTMQRMTIDLCRLYGVRPGRLESLIILGHVLAAATLAAGGDEASDAVAEQIQETLANSIGAIGAGLVGNIGGRTAEGAVNAMFARRIGFRLQRYLSPIRE